MKRSIEKMSETEETSYTPEGNGVRSKRMKTWSRNEGRVCTTLLLLETWQCFTKPK